MRPSLDRIQHIAAAALESGALASGRSILVHDFDCLHHRLEALQGAFPANALHAVAIKANPVVTILQAVVDAGLGLEAASIEEVHLALAAGCPPDRLVFDSPAKTHDELRESLDLGVRINCDNLEELQRVDSIQPPATSIIGLRVNPAVGSGTISATSVAGKRSRFGVPMQDAIEYYERFPWLNAVHMHVGSQGCSMEQLLTAAEKLVRFRDEVGRDRLPYVDIGGGLPVAYTSDDSPPSFDTYTSKLRERAGSLFEEDVQLVTEFGRAIHANCGIALSRIEYVKDLGGVTSIVNHLGADLLLRPVYNPDDWAHEFALLTPNGDLKTGPTTQIQIGGPLCFGGDIIGREVKLPSPNVGDWLVIRDVGAYTLSMWSRHCSRGLPPVWKFGAEGLLPLWSGEKPSDVVSFWS